MAKHILDTLHEESTYPTDESEIIHVADLCERAPNLHDYMRYEFWNGKPCGTPKITFQVQNQVLWVGVSDADGFRSCRFECSGIEHGFAFLEGLISSQKLAMHFRDWPSKPRGKAKNESTSSNSNGTQTRTSKSTSSRRRTGTKVK